MSITAGALVDLAMAKGFGWIGKRESFAYYFFSTALAALRMFGSP